MCWGIEIMDGERVIARAYSVREAVAIFGPEHMRLTQPETPGEYAGGLDLTADHCLCPVDTDYLIKANGYQMIPMDDPRWSPIDHRIEKI